MKLVNEFCDCWIDIKDHSCPHRWKQEIKLEKSTKVGKGPMMGTYPAGIWKFCNIHYKIFNRDMELS
jgi:hypothetical protein